MRDLLVDVGNRRDDDDALFRLALALARQHRAHVTGMQVITLDPLVLSLPEALTVLDEEERAALERRDWWLALCRKHRVNGEWCVDRGFYQSVMVRRAVFADLVLAGLDGLGNLASGGASLLGRSILADSVPVLLVPERSDISGPPEKILIAWNGSIESARAIRASHPLLAKAAEVIVLDGEMGRKSAAPPSLPLREWLKRRSIHARWLPGAGARASGRHIQSLAEEHGIDLIVMGAWGHLRMSEWLLGGITRHMLKHSRIPLLLAH
ncbi:universal stress protein [Dyella japonica]|uniref:Nucleotide-binding universal stress UspA family protein n=1 Tax=Dyella japonica TaxID=231455 RepID=A0ABV2JRU6_9GAMM